VNCQENDPAVLECAVGQVPAGAIELEEVESPPTAATFAPIDTLSIWLDALLRAAEDQTEVWMEKTSWISSPRDCEHQVCAKASHTVAVQPSNEVDISTDEDPQEQPPAKLGGVLTKWGFFPNKPVIEQCPLCRAARACAECVNCAVNTCVQEARVCFLCNEQDSPEEAAEPQDSECDTPKAPTPANPCPKQESACPYMQNKASQVPQASRERPVDHMSATPLDNLKKLDHAQKLMQAAEAAQKASQMDKACELYQKIQYVCPGSRLAVIAEERVKVLTAIKAVQQQNAPAGEEQEKAPEKKEDVPQTSAPPASGACTFVMKRFVIVAPSTAEVTTTVLENLKNLEQAHKMFEEAHQCLRAGMTDQACALFRQIHLVCPGSPVDRIASIQCEVLLAKLNESRMLLRQAMEQVLDNHYEDACKVYETLEKICPGSFCAQIAAEHLALLHDRMTAARAKELRERGMAIQAAVGGVEEQNTPEQKATPCPCDTEKVAELLEACQRALTDGHYKQAEALAREALELDPESVGANALVYRTHLLVQIEKKIKAAERLGKRKKAAVVPLKPHMPEVDPTVVQDFEQVLKDQQTGREASEEAEPPAKKTPAVEEEDDPVDPQARAERHDQVERLMKEYHRLYRKGKYAAAAAAATKANELDPKYASKLAARQVSPMSESKQAARKTDTSANLGDPVSVDHVEKRLAAALMDVFHDYYKQGKYDEAEIVAARAHELDPENVAAAAAVQVARMAARVREGQPVIPGNLAADDWDSPMGNSSWADLYDHCMTFLHTKTGVEIDVSSCGGMRMRCEYHWPSCGWFVLGLTSGLERGLSAFSLSMPGGLTAAQGQTDATIRWIDAELIEKTGIGSSN
jgi:tetratricopeptide (TPR) repeat protein